MNIYLYMYNIYKIYIYHLYRYYLSFIHKLCICIATLQRKNNLQIRVTGEHFHSYSVSDVTVQHMPC